MAAVKIQVPNMGQSLEGVLVGVEKQSLLLTVKLRPEAEGFLLRPNALVRIQLGHEGMPQLLTAVVHSFAPPHVVLKPTSPAQSHERRARRRYPVNIPATLFYQESSAPVRIVNINAAGVGLHAPLLVPQEQTAALEFSIVSEEVVVRAVIQVRHARPLADGLHYIGASFAEINRTDALWLRKLFP